MKYKAYSPINNEVWDSDKLVLNGIYLSPNGMGLVDVHNNMQKTILIPLRGMGWRDRHLKEIYEYDIVKCYYGGRNVNCFVKWNEVRSEFQFIMLDGNKHKIDTNLLAMYNEEETPLVLIQCEIIGNALIKP